tara:strand:- start:14091 stop:14252 length:162 start_codon:yes stop_codon:yes gene_type:complete
LPNESINLYLGGDKVCELTIMSHRGRSVRVGIEAPDDVKIIRSEIDTKEDSKE